MDRSAIQRCDRGAISDYVTTIPGTMPSCASLDLRQMNSLRIPETDWRAPSSPRPANASAQRFSWELVGVHVYNIGKLDYMD